MKNKRFIIIFSIILAILCLFQLSFTYQARSFENKAKSWAKSNVSKFESETKAYRKYIDSMGNKSFFLGYSYFECKQKEINLGLDLRGGLNVILEVDKGAIVKGMSNDPKDADLNRALVTAEDNVVKKGGDFVEYFVDAFKSIAPNRKLANLFVKNSSTAITSESSVNDIVKVLKEETSSAIKRVREVVEKRINQSNVTQPTVQEIDNGRISVELPGVDNPRRMEELVEKSAKLEFYEVYGNYSTQTSLVPEGNEILAQLYKISNQTAEVETPDSSTKAVDDTNKVAAVKKDTGKKEAAKPEVSAKGSALEKILVPVQMGGASGTVCKVKAGNRLTLEEMLKQKKFVSFMETKGMRVVTSAKPGDNPPGQKYYDADEYAVYFLKLSRNGGAALSSESDNIIEDAGKVRNYEKGGEVAVDMVMTPAAANAWAGITGRNAGHQIAIVLDDKVYSAPNVNERISGGRSQISGSFTDAEGDDLANVLKAGKLPAPAKIVASEVVGPSLGSQAISRGFLSLAIGFISVILFMAFYYHRAGWFAIIAVLGNIFLLMGILASLGAALTLPGMAGLVLTVGMAVDANVLIFERIKEELRHNMSLPTAVKNGYKHAFTAIFDSNLTTLIAGLTLLLSGAGPAYGFAVIFVIGIFSSMYTALILTRWLIDYRVRNKKPMDFSYSYSQNVMTETNYNFVKNRRKAYLVSLPIIVLGIVCFIYKGGLSTGIDFKGGNSYIIEFEKNSKVSVADIKDALDKGLPGMSNEVKSFGSQNQFRVITTYGLDKANNKEARDSVAAKVLNCFSGLKLAKEPIKASSKIGAAVATNTRNKSATLVAVAILLMFLYIVLRFRSPAYGLGATIALLHDVVFVLACFSILDGWVPFPVEFDQNLIAALLTVLAYSMNDTVIVFDRIREYLSANKSADRNDEALINKAINQTLSRTIITSATVFFICLVLFLFGGDSLKGFSLALLLGILIGTYSSIFIATPVVVEFGKGKKNVKKSDA